MEPVTTAALVGGGLAAGGSLITSAWNMATGASNRRWQERMDNTKYQRAMADMRAAGLNPILAAGGGIGGGSVPNPPTPTADVNVAQLGEGVSSAAKVTAIDKARVANETRSTDAQVATAAVQREVSSAQVAKTVAETAVLAKEVDSKVAHTLLAHAQRRLTDATARNVRAETPAKELKAEAYSKAKGILDTIRDSSFGRAMAGTWKYWTSPSQTYATGQGNANGGLHSAHEVGKVRQLTGSHRRGEDLGVERRFNQSMNRKFNQ